MRLFTLFLVLASAVPLAAEDTTNEAAKKEAEKLQGSWYVVSDSVAGASIPWMELQDAEVAIKGQELIFKNFCQNSTQSSFFRVGSGGPVHRPVLESILTVELEIVTKDFPPFSYELDVTTEPKHIDFHQKQALLPGIYALQGNQLTICLAAPRASRPQDLSPGPDRILLVLGRKKADQEARNQSIHQEQERLRGTWTVTRGRYDIEGLSDKDLNGFRLTFGAAGLKWEEAGAANTLAVQIDPDATPAAIDLVPTGGPYKGRTIRGIYRLERDRLRLRLPPSFSMPRPKDLTDEEGVDAVLILKRASR
jgi:uncharacterized protein (TIGR03067 family)